MVHANHETLHMLSAVTAGEKRYRGPMEATPPPPYQVGLDAKQYENRVYSVVSGLYRDRRFEVKEIIDESDVKTLEDAVNDVPECIVDKDEC